MDDLKFLSSERVKNFIRENEQADIQKLILNPPGEFKDRIALIADQIISRKKAKDKLSTWYNCGEAILPPPLSLEQSSSTLTAHYKSGLLSGDRLIDLTGGMGVDLLALSARFREVSYVEQSEWLCELFRHNSPLFTDSAIRIHHQSAEAFLEDFRGKATFFMDPARRDDQSKKRVFLFDDCSPNVLSLLPLLRLKARQVLIKAAPMIDISLGIRQLENVTAVHVVSVRNECKEVLFKLDFEYRRAEPPEIVCINLTNQGEERLVFRLDMEKTIDPPVANPMQYLYDPNAAILKAGAFRTLTAHFPIQKLAPNTHLYTSDRFIEGFPGRIFEVMTTNAGKADLNSLKQANILTRNYPLRPEAIRKKYKLKDGGELFLIGCRDMNGRSILILGRRLR